MRFSEKPMRKIKEDEAGLSPRERSALRGRRIETIRSQDGLELL